MGRERSVRSEIECRPYCATPYADATAAEAGIEAFIRELQCLMERHNIFAVAGCFSADYGEDSYCSGNMFMGVTDQALMSAIQDVREVSMNVIRQKAAEEMLRELKARQPERPSPVPPSGWKRYSDGAIPPPEVAAALQSAWMNDWFQLGPMEFDGELYEPTWDGEG